MVQCADSISSALAEMEAATNYDAVTTQPSLQTKLKDLIGTSIDAIHTIQACATHQKRIVDDILTLSKLDSKLLVISPITMQPYALLQDAYKIFKEEANKARVNLSVHSDASFNDLQINYAILDPSRVLQVLINLLTNAIKFTHSQSVRNVEVTMSATWLPAGRPGIEYVPQKALSQDFLDEQEWGSGEVFYLHFTVKDTGCGLTTEHKNRLFLRFSQASPRTHVQVCLLLLTYVPFSLTFASMEDPVLVCSSHRNSQRCKVVVSAYSQRKVLDPPFHSISKVEEPHLDGGTRPLSSCLLGPNLKSSRTNSPCYWKPSLHLYLPQSIIFLLSKITSSISAYFAISSRRLAVLYKSPTTVVKHLLNWPKRNTGSNPPSRSRTISLLC